MLPSHARHRTRCHYHTHAATITLAATITHAFTDGYTHHVINEFLLCIQLHKRILQQLRHHTHVPRPQHRQASAPPFRLLVTTSADVLLISAEGAFGEQSHACARAAAEAAESGAEAAAAPAAERAAAPGAVRAASPLVPSRARIYTTAAAAAAHRPSGLAGHGVPQTGTICTPVAINAWGNPASVTRASKGAGLIHRRGDSI
eukprot:1160756-Pelagomonas_calceolata.AAC.8